MCDIRSNDWYVRRKACDSDQEVPEEYHNPIQLDTKADERPADKDKDDAGSKGRCAFKLFPPCEEADGLLETDDDGKTYKEKNLQVQCS